VRLHKVKHKVNYNLTFGACIRSALKTWNSFGLLILNLSVTVVFHSQQTFKTVFQSTFSDYSDHSTGHLCPPITSDPGIQWRI